MGSPVLLASKSVLNVLNPWRFCLNLRVHFLYFLKKDSSQDCDGDCFESVDHFLSGVISTVSKPTISLIQDK